MNDTIVITASCADVASPDLLPAEGHSADAPFGNFSVFCLDHSGFETAPRAVRGRHTRVSYRLNKMIPRLLERAGLTADALAGPGCGMVSGSSYGCSQVYEMHRRLKKMGPRGVDAVRFAQATHNYPVSACAIDYKIEGPCLSVLNAETAGLDALQCAQDWLRAGRCDRVLVAAYEDLAPPIGDHLADRARSLPKQGFGEAMVLVLLEKASVAQRRDDLPILTHVAPVPPGGAGLSVTSHSPGSPGFTPRTLEYLGAGGLIALHDLLNSPEAGQRGPQQWQISAAGQSGSGIVAGIGIGQMEDCL
ncbi:beta-ketoacyl synthase N-terminal-like domain-containing protein [Primorskyibacter aestuariivivens]|uniref:beta-ketoacyl synthase N-terminal-like domain-containing protein n=1 Tax=Primorskyibacter aestuariivivens TaxID=1888912 RepID=UPI0022FFFE32|nr:beta-ketoacyl synthase N-terminal-like domain-containing protein [Primorskyibacter aestuariivivens]MDA7429488.1 beta-ketoacyl synthase N-terminal-like domain-containing protein [Primorskyibacter aestuariivivens]